jgi:hypothetical protein
VPPIAIGHGWAWTSRLHRYGSVCSIGFGVRRGSSALSGPTNKPGDEHDGGSGDGDEQHVRAEPEAEQRERHEAGGDHTAPAGDLDPVSGEAEQRRQQCDRGDHRDGDGDRGADGEAAHELDAHEQHPEQ